MNRIAIRRLSLLCWVGACTSAGDSPTSAPSALVAGVASVQVRPARVVMSRLGSGPGTRLSADVLDCAGQRLVHEVGWATSDSQVVQVDAQGLLVARASGSAWVTAISGGARDSAWVHVAVYHNDFETQAEGPMTAGTLGATWNGASSGGEFWEGRVDVLAGDQAYDAGRSLRVRYPRGGVGPANGAVWVMPLDRPYTELYAAYRVRFAPGFDFVRGGKLPALAGGAGNSGGVRPNGFDGWSGRVMWLENGRLLQYVYHPDQSGLFGEGMTWATAQQQQVRAVPGRWHLIEQRVVMNTPGQRNGRMQAWLDGVAVLDRQNIRFRDTAALGIDIFQFSTFFGGSVASMAATRDEEIWFDDFTISTARPAPAGPAARVPRRCEGTT